MKQSQVYFTIIFMVIVQLCSCFETIYQKTYIENKCQTIYCQCSLGCLNNNDYEYCMTLCKKLYLNCKP